MYISALFAMSRPMSTPRMIPCVVPAENRAFALIANGNLHGTEARCFPECAAGTKAFIAVSDAKERVLCPQSAVVR